MKHKLYVDIDESRPSPLTEGRGLKLRLINYMMHVMDVAPHRGAWIETAPVCPASAHGYVAPHRGAWIETDCDIVTCFCKQVAPHRGAWIETIVTPPVPRINNVAPHRGAWIETL